MFSTGTAQLIQPWIYPASEVDPRGGLFCDLLLFHVLVVRYCTYFVRLKSFFEYGFFQLLQLFLY